MSINKSYTDTEQYRNLLDALAPMMRALFWIDQHGMVNYRKLSNDERKALFGDSWYEHRDECMWG